MEGKTACVTGASGYVGGVMCMMLSDRGYNVKATVRSLDKPRKCLEELKNVKLYEADLLIPNSFDEAFEGCDVVFHTAAVVRWNTSDPVKDIIEPVMKGMRNTFNSALKYKVPFFVATSSCAAVMDEEKAGQVLSERDYNEHTDPLKTPYRHGKVMSEKLLWKLADENKDKIKVATICPSLIIGPYLDDNSTTFSVNTIKSVIDGSLRETGYLFENCNTIDVRDVCMAHILAYEKGRNERFIASSYHGTGGKEWAKILSKKYPDLPYATKLSPDARVYDFKYDNRKVKELLGGSLIDLETSLIDMVDHFFKVGVMRNINLY